MNNKDLINAGHALAKAISNATPLIEIAKMVSNLATQLDVQIARSNQLSIALEAAEKRIAELEEREVTLPERYEVEMYPTPSPDGDWYSREDVLAALAAAGLKVAAAGKGE
ncbi:hypothetical protein [Enterobacter sichuanensis]|uniref:hypothetical protein n=1 Tax=Enterobacter sichuanensis TaxID=2071710 RepID=UPI000CEF069C|nr:hypothetical protein [Enterobacter sichuanensis]